MKHSEYIKSLNIIGSKTAYARKIGLTPSFLSQIKAGKATTPTGVYQAVVQETNGLVTYEDLLSERKNNQKTRIHLSKE